MTAAEGPHGPERLDDLHFPPPACPRDGAPVDCDGNAWWCEECGATWALDGTGGARQPELAEL